MKKGKQLKKLIRYIKIPKIRDDCFLYVAEFATHIPFPIKRIYYLTTLKPGAPRGFHAHKKTKQVLFCIQGSVRLVLEDGVTRKEVLLQKPNLGIFLDHLIWHEMHDISRDTLLLVLASKTFDPDDYIRDYQVFKHETNTKYEPNKI